MKLILAIVLGAFALNAQNDPKSSVKVNKSNDPEKAVKFEVMIPAPVEKVWEAFTTNAGLTTWLWSNVTVDLRPGGDWTVHYPGGATGGGTIVSLIPGRQLVMRAMAPEKFPTVRRERTRVVWDFDAVGSETRVTLTQTGWKDGQEWDDAYEYLAKGNAQLLDQLRYRFVKGPIDWNAARK